MEVVRYVRQHQHEHVERDLGNAGKEGQRCQRGGFPNDAIPSLQNSNIIKTVAGGIDSSYGHTTLNKQRRE